MDNWPKDIGILALEVYTPSQYVDQTELEVFDAVSSGKYTVGLGQQKMGFCTDREDINSLCLTAVQNLMENYNVKPQDIGYLAVGTETIIDKSKSVKTVLMQLFEPHGVTDIEGLDSKNACYGGTAALINAISWVESSYWNGRYALVVAADIAVYAKGSARPTGGAGEVAMLLGTNAALVFDRGVRASYAKHSYDFYKPDFATEYPVVDGQLSIQNYLIALDHCYALYKKKLEEKQQLDVTLKDFDAVLFHTPYCKLVQKSVARLALNDYLQKPDMYPELEEFQKVKLENNYFDRHLEKTFMDVSRQQFAEKTQPSLFVASQVGNMYTASIYGGLVSLLVNKKPSELVGNKIVLFSYGGGSIASMFSLTISNNTNDLENITSHLKCITSRLEQRQECSPSEFEASLELRQKVSHKVPYKPVSSIKGFFPGTYYLVKIDEMCRRFYKRIV